MSLSDDRNRILGVGTEPVEGESEVAVAPLSCITAKSGALLVEFNAEHARAQAIE